ncbi:hypothetical protein KFK09_005972 [Dendrobium nobile]|uniref:Uncharacterized protein n=1 Tax=Dendrobium nobile TaxID=94219 RepID=A0A8T3C2W4_DENNO|nr:hypothetical protein KFK09_005972 [Dendrobium nobile]
MGVDSTLKHEPDHNWLRQELLVSRINTPFYVNYAFSAGNHHLSLRHSDWSTVAFAEGSCSRETVELFSPDRGDCMVQHYT